MKVRKNEVIIAPLIDYISEYLRNCYESQVKIEDKSNPMPMGITANYSTVVVANKVEGDVSNVVTINEQINREALDIVDSIKETLIQNKMENEADIMDILKLIEGDIQVNNKPKKRISCRIEGAMWRKRSGYYLNKCIDEIIRFELIPVLLYRSLYLVDRAI